MGGMWAGHWDGKKKGGQVDERKKIDKKNF